MSDTERDTTCAKCCTCNQRASEPAPPCPESYDKILAAVTAGMLGADKRMSFGADDWLRRDFAARVHDVARAVWLARDNAVLARWRNL